mmetsp:Transcript_6651/g.12011  ORF Transcript_6651/g.12011 Transcript_6651/m.12011 type:complete len:295 (-) Transcript_6651:669-1553(-)
MAGRGVHEAGTALRRDVVPADDQRGGAAVEGVGVGGAFQLRARQHREFTEPEAPLLRKSVDEILRHYEPLRQQTLRALSLRLDDRVFEVAVHRDGQVGGDGPRRGGPNRKRSALKRSQGVSTSPARHGRQRHGDVDAGRGVALRVLQLRLGKGGSRGGAPVNRLPATIDVTVEQHLTKHLELLGLILREEGEVGILPVSPDSVAPELIPLRLHRLHCKVARLIAQLKRRQLGSRLVRHRLQHLQLDGQAVAVPTGAVPHTAALQHLEPIDKVFQDFIQRMTDVEVAVGVRWAVM